MIRLATIKDKHTLAQMLRAMYIELFPADAEQELEPYISTIQAHIDAENDYVYVDDKYRGFFIVRDETEAIAPTLRRWNGIRVYIHPNYRKSPLLAAFYAHLFESHTDGDILGVTEIGSEHIKVMNKRHELIAQVYKLNRR